jgi:hydrogenase nickel incorporation protein HypA/HybF
VHEYSIIQSLVGRVEAEARKRKATAIHRLKVRIGELAGVDPELLATAYDTFRAGTVCAAASLEIVRVPARWTCRTCGVAIPVGAVLRCAACDEPATLVEGDDIILDQIELEVP